ncbi:hypothetical protein N7526_001428 [Penicillium atrosanguineum]|nr:hypothetical protein N7526_001428 [Penicillium atrosanguineum]
MGRKEHIERSVQKEVMTKVKSESDWTYDMFTKQGQVITKLVEKNEELGIEIETHARKIRKLEGRYDEVNAKLIHHQAHVDKNIE